MIKIYIKTYGCSHNISDSEQMAGLLAGAGYKMVFKEEEADIVIINSCTVKDPSEKSFQSFMKKIVESGIPVVIAGCVPQADPANELYSDLSVLGVEQIESVVEVVEQTLKGEIVKKLSREKKGSSILLPKIRRNNLIEIIPINVGCLGNCNYCKTKQARNHLRSYSIDEIIQRMRVSLNEGVKEFWITSEDVGAYGLDIKSEKTNLPILMKAIREINKDFKVRIGMANPNHIMKFLDEFIEQLRDDKFYKFVHIPIQSASNNVLKEMNRFYKKEDFELIFKRLQKEFKDITVATDYILGYPTETINDFEETLSFVKKNHFRTQNITQFYPRPNTPATKLKLLSTKEVKKRAKLVMNEFQSFNPNEDFLGKTVEALFIDKGKKGTIVGHSDNYVQVIVEGDQDLLGEKKKVKILETNKFYVKGEIVE